MKRANLFLFLFCLLLAVPSQAKIIYVDANAPGANNGQNWANAYKYLQDALNDADSAVKPVEIRVAEGIYTPDSNSADPNGSGDRTATFQLINGVTIKGGYAGVGEADPNARDIERYETTLSGDLDGNDVDVNDPADLLDEQTRAENSYHVVTGSGQDEARILDETTVLDGFTVTGGNANGPWLPGGYDSGGGLYCDSEMDLDITGLRASPTLIDCTFVRNTGEQCGGGIYMRYSNPALINCSFICNATTGEYGRGGGMYIGSGYPELTDCVFTRNFATGTEMGGHGGGLYDAGCTILTRCTFIANSATSCGGGMLNRGSSTLIDCTFIGNNSHWGGGLCNDDNSNPTLTNCAFTGNSAGSGGGMCNFQSSSPTLTKCVFSGNLAWSGGGMLNHEGSTPTVNNCLFKGNSADYRGGGMCNYECDTTVTGSIFSGNTAEHYGGAIYNSKVGRIGSRYTVKLVNCTVAGNWAESGSAVACDTLCSICSPGNLSVANCILWNGGDEIWSKGVYTITITYSDVQGGAAGIYVPHHSTLNWGEGNIDQDPCFADLGYWADANDPNIPVEPNDPNAVWVDGDYHLKSQAGRWEPSTKMWVRDDVTSPCIDAGNPGCPEANEPAPNGNRRNMGAFGGTAEASKSPANWRSIADLTNDWVVDSNDLKVFVNYWLYGGQCIPSDLNRNQSVDFADYGIFALQWSDPSASEPSMTFQIDDCNMEEGQSWPVAAESNEPRFSVWVEGRYIHFEDLMYANCCPDELGLDKEINGNQITLYEIGYGGLCDCMCYFPIKATLGPFEDGTYTVEVFDNYGQSLGIVEVTIGETTGPGIEYQIFPCNRELFTVEQSGQTRFTVTVEGSYIHFEDMMAANCCPDELGLEMTVEDNLITIYETEYTPGGCHCNCDYPVTATLGPFEPGIYTLEVYESGHFIGSTTVVIAPPE